MRFGRLVRWQPLRCRAAELGCRREDRPNAGVSRSRQRGERGAIAVVVVAVIRSSWSEKDPFKQSYQQHIAFYPFERDLFRNGLRVASRSVLPIDQNYQQHIAFCPLTWTTPYKQQHMQRFASGNNFMYHHVALGVCLPRQTAYIHIFRPPPVRSTSTEDFHAIFSLI